MNDKKRGGTEERSAEVKKHMDRSHLDDTLDAKDRNEGQHLGERLVLSGGRTC